MFHVCITVTYHEYKLLLINLLHRAKFSLLLCLLSVLVTNVLVWLRKNFRIMQSNTKCMYYRSLQIDGHIYIHIQHTQQCNSSINISN